VRVICRFSVCIVLFELIAVFGDLVSNLWWFWYVLICELFVGLDF